MAFPPDDGRGLREARYRFAVTIRIEPTLERVSISPAAFETALYYRAVVPKTDGWMFFRDNLWRGDVTDHAGVRDRTAAALAVPVTRVEFRPFGTDVAYLGSLRWAIADSLGEFKAETVDEVITKYLGSKLRVFEGDPPEYCPGQTTLRRLRDSMRWTTDQPVTVLTTK